ncbi:Por_Secre_tail, Por secretion system C-terminal sorting domain [Flavobacteriaceae bacterium]
MVKLATCPTTTGKFEIVSSDEFKVVAYPNPYASTFQLNFTTTSESQVEMRVYDMIGKLIEVRQFSTTEMNNQEVGNNYPSGIYNIIVTQGENVKTLRVIKR